MTTETRMNVTSTKRTAVTRKAWLGAAALAVVVTGMWSSMTPAMAAAVVDQDTYNNDGQPFNSGYLFSANIVNSRPYAQTFTAGITGALTDVTLALQKNGAGAGATASVYTIAGGIPDCALATADVDPTIVSPVSSPIALDSVRILFTTVAQVQAGTQYAIVVFADAGQANIMSWTGFQNGLNSGGSVLVRTSGTWGPLTGQLAGADLGFTTYVDSSLTGVNVCSASSGGESAIVDNTIWYQSYGRLNADQQCASGYTGSWAQWANGNRGGFVCNRAVYSYRPEAEATNVFFGTWRTS